MQKRSKFAILKNTNCIENIFIENDGFRYSSQKRSKFAILKNTNCIENIFIENDGFRYSSQKETENGMIVLQNRSTKLASYDANFIIKKTNMISPSCKNKGSVAS